MEATRRYWTTVALAGLLALWAVILERPPLLVGATSVAAWLLVRQYRFVRTANETVATLDIEQHLARRRVTAEETVLGTLDVQAEQPVSVALHVDASPPVGSTAAPASCTLGVGEQAATTTFEVTWPVAGHFEFGQPTIRMTDSLELFTQTTAIGTTPSVTVEPRAPRDIHVGEGGGRIDAGFGEHEAGYTGSGLTPAEVRKYVHGDSAKQIDWKATARLDEPHIREFEAETDLETLLIVDHRATMQTGRPGETKLDFARQVALALVDSAQELGDPLGWYGVGDGGLTDSFTPTTDDSQYRTISQRIRALEPTVQSGRNRDSAALDPATARRTADRLAGESAFETKLRPFFEDADSYIQRVADEPLFGALRMADARLDGTVRTVIITGDDHRTELREAVKIARRGNGQVVVFLTPTVLYEPGTLTDLDDAYRRYADFEAFRRELAASSRVSAFEVGPSDRLASVLSAGQRRRRAEQ